MTSAMQANLFSSGHDQWADPDRAEDLSTGKAVNSAADNATAFFEAQSATNEASQLTT